MSEPRTMLDKVWAQHVIGPELGLTQPGLMITCEASYRRKMPWLASKI
jgi:hypothetical protein